MRFSVIIPLFNKYPHIKDSIESVLTQSFNDFEIIVVDDGSTDGGGAIVESINDQRICLVCQGNRGVSAARNKGIEMAKANYIAFLDADDIWLPNHLEILDRLITMYPGCGLYTTTFKRMDKSGEFINENNIKKPVGWHDKFNFDGYLDLVTKRYVFCTDTICIWKPIFLEIGKFEVGLTRGEDLDMWLRVALHSPVAFINVITAIVNLGSVNRSHKRWSRELGEGLKRHAALLESEAFSVRTRKKLYEYYAMRMINRGTEALLNGHQKEAFYCIKQSYKTKIFRYAFIKLLIKYVFSFTLKTNTY